MNAQARIVENYFRIVKRCLTITDVKVPAGQNRQFDILAYQPEKKKFYHIEVGVTHIENWCPTLNKLRIMFKQKFFGVPQNKRPDNKDTDYAKGKDYLDQIKETYSRYSIKYEKVIRVWCFWAFNGDNEEIIQLKNELAQEFNLDSENFETLSLRDSVIPELEMEIGTSNYDDEILRTFSLLKQCNEQNNQHSIKNKITKQVYGGISSKISKYLFNGEEYKHNGRNKHGKNGLVLAVIKKYLIDNPQTSYKELLKKFPDKLQGALGVLRKMQTISDERRYFKDSLKTGDGVEVAVCTQWGEYKDINKNNIKKFVDYVNKNLGYKIEKRF